jgi:hypothetical protein
MIWKDNRNEDAQEIIDYLFPQIKGNGITVSFLNTIAFKELSAITKDNISTSSILHVLAKMKKSNKKGTLDFEELYNEEYVKRELTKNKWEFFLPTEIMKGKYKSKSFQICNKKFNISSYQSLQKYLGMEPMNRNIKSLCSDSLVITKVFFVVRERGINLEDAWNKISPAFELLRGIFQFVTSMSKCSYNSGNIPLTSYQHPQWMLIKRPNNEIEGRKFFVDSCHFKKEIELNKNQYIFFNDILRLFKNKPDEKSTLSVLANSLRLYSQALDAKYRYNCFLSLWQALEAISVSEFVGGSTEKIKKRIIWHTEKYKLVGTGLKETLEVLSDKRNNLVHRGIDNIDQDDINILKIVCETALKWIIEEHNNLKTKLHLNEFYRLRTSSEKEIEAISDCIKYINKKKENSKKNK